MKTIYLDNAATTSMLPEVIDLVSDLMKTTYGNPSSTHHIGRKSKSLVETARKNIAKHFKAAPNEIVFTAGGSEADNLILKNAVENLGVKTIISSKIEHHAVLHTIEFIEKNYNVEVKWLDIDENGVINFNQLEGFLKLDSSKKLVSLMYVNNEIGNILNIQKVSDLCIENNAYFHSDAVQAVGHFNFDVQQTPIDFFAASAHKFHGPKGVGFAYIKNGIGIQPLLLGGEQERGARAGTENVHSILGMEEALKIAYQNINIETVKIQALKNYFIAQLKQNLDEVKFNGFSEDITKSSYIILNVRFPKDYSMMLFSLDLKGIAVSGGSACQSGSNKGSHVLNTILNEDEAKKTSIRFSFSKFNTKEELDTVIKVLKELKI
ncbi:cysteine desulfurase family protein [Lutibacter sp. TH_r2]|uniref:cysteine desulfurase family protein n=1 Tax=Lutibacter sp. TH_r2 TaxID=3082083 RepID=UPI002952AF43|nr:cysteine desulfurase family protein [Lutibacter sp. TH_r2]MDV7188086.1 cysteine desulfurase family protein [Lutibacter sp. TH_r2]